MAGGLEMAGGLCNTLRQPAFKPVGSKSIAPPNGEMNDRK